MNHASSHSRPMQFVDWIPLLTCFMVLSNVNFGADNDSFDSLGFVLKKNLLSDSDFKDLEDRFVELSSA